MSSENIWKHLKFGKQVYSDEYLSSSKLFLVFLKGVSLQCTHNHWLIQPINVWTSEIVKNFETLFRSIWARLLAEIIESNRLNLWKNFQKTKIWKRESFLTTFIEFRAATKENNPTYFLRSFTSLLKVEHSWSLPFSWACNPKNQALFIIFFDSIAISHREFSTSRTNNHKIVPQELQEENVCWDLSYTTRGVHKIFRCSYTIMYLHTRV